MGSETDATGTSSKPFETFELITALLLGLAAIGAAVAGVQSNQWGGKQMEAYADANVLTTKAAKSYSEAVSDMNNDYSVIGQAKQRVLQGVDASNDAERKRDYRIASYYLNRQLSQTAYNALKLPGSAAHPAADAGKTGPNSKPAEDVDTVEELEAELDEVMPSTVLIKFLDSELHDDDAYETEMFAEGNKLFADADKRFAEGRKANENGDEFELAGLYFTIALFFGGISLVFKTRVRWMFCGLGIVTLIASTVYLYLRTWPPA
jgi:hypothetical protein